MKSAWLAAVLLLWSRPALAEPVTACLFAPVELSVTLGHTSKAGVSSTNGQGQPGCQYAMEGTTGIYFWVRIDPKCDQKRFESQARTRQSISGKTNVTLKGAGDAAYFSAGGTAAARAGSRCVELSGLRAGAKRVVTPSEAEKLLALAVTRVGR